MILVDASVWIDHLDSGDPVLPELMSTRSILVRPFVLGEISCGSFKNRAVTLRLSSKLPLAKTATHKDASELLECRKLWKTAIGWINVHPLASALITRCGFWTRDLRLQKAASLAGVAFTNVPTDPAASNPNPCGTHTDHAYSRI